MTERRKFKRVELGITVKCRLIDDQKKISVSRDILSRSKNLSEGGVLLEWPRSWSCDNCSNCLGWIYNMNCKLKDKGYFEEESNRDLLPNTHLSLQLVPGYDLEPVETTGKVAWVSKPEGQNPSTYNIGVSFSEKKRSQKDPYLSNKILFIKKKFGVSQK